MNKKSIIFLFIITAVFFIVCRRGKTEIPGQDKTRTSTLHAAIQQLVDHAVILVRQKKFLEAKIILKPIIEAFPNYPERAKIEKKLGDINIHIIRSDLRMPQTTLYTVQSADTIGSIAQEFKTTAELIKVSNKLSNTIIRPGQGLRVWTKPFNIEINKTGNTLTLKMDEETIKIYPVATGAEGATPAGEYTITSKLENPVWFHKGEAIPSKDPRNAFGTRWLGLDNPQYGIHGTIQPSLIGQQVSKGCVRMHNKDVEEIYDLVPLGTKVTIVD